MGSVVRVAMVCNRDVRLEGLIVAETCGWVVSYMPRKSRVYVGWVVPTSFVGLKAIPKVRAKASIR